MPSLGSIRTAQRLYCVTGTSEIMRSRILSLRQRLHVAARLHRWRLTGRRPDQVTAPIFAVRSREQLDDVLGSLDFSIPQANLAALDEVSSLDLGFPQRWGDGDFFVSRGQTIEKRGIHAL